MSPASPSPVQRRARIAALLGAQTFWSQQDLARALRKNHGIVVTQATLSRDLTELGVVKGPDGYVLPTALALTGHAGLAGHAGHSGSAGSSGLGGGDGENSRRQQALSHALRQHFVGAARGGTLVVVRTPTGHANSLAVELDRAKLPGVLGTIAGDDTIFLAMRDTEAATSLVRMLERLAHAPSSAGRGESAA